MSNHVCLSLGTVVCKIESIDGNFSSFLPPRVGNQITINAAQNQIARIQVDNSHGMIPVLHPLLKHSDPLTANYMVNFQADQDDSDTVKSSLNLMVGKFQDENGRANYQGQIQHVVTEKYNGIVTVTNAKLACKPAN
ncbi:MAG: hypothetical protein ACXVBE_07215 [Bdellovibrionota bacterium]